MVDELDDQAPASLRPAALAGRSRRRHLHFLVPLLFGWLIVWGVSWVIPPVYRSGTLILVEQPTMPKAYVTPNVSDDLQERLQSITQQILSRTRLLQIIDQVKIYGDEHKQLTPDEKVERMRKDIEIELVHDAHNDKITAFNVYYSARDPHLAQKVTSELTNLFINENVEVRQQQSEDTTQFLQNQLETARNTLAEQEEKIREFKGQHVGEMPAQQQSNLQILWQSERTAIPAPERRGCAEHGEPAAHLSSDADRSVPDPARNGVERWWRSGKLAGDRQRTRKIEDATGGTEISLHRPPSGHSQSERTDCPDGKNKRRADCRPGDKECVARRRTTARRTGARAIWRRTRLSCNCKVNCMPIRLRSRAANGPSRS